jgi:uncharacterized protein YndB with AHSA1/START domain
VIEPLTLSFDVICDARHAFTVWTEHAAAWWPAGHTARHERGVHIVFEPRVGGRIFERTLAQVEHDWGNVTAWEPPHRLAYRWHIATDPSNATAAKIRFIAIGPSATRVEVHHDGWDRLGSQQGRQWRTVNRGGWDGVLPNYPTVCASSHSRTNQVRR